MSFNDCLKNLLNGKAIDQEEEDWLRAEYNKRLRSMSEGAAKEKLEADLAARAAIVKRQQMLMVRAHDNIVKDALQYRDANGRRNIFNAFDSMFEDFGYAGYPSARFIGEALIGMANSRLADFMEHFERKTFYSNGSLIGGRSNKADMKEVQKAMFGDNHVSPVASALAKGLLETDKWLWQLFNERSGGTIGWLENWGGPQSHDPDAVIRAGGFTGDPAKARAYWSKYIDALINWRKMRNPITGEIFGPGIGDNSRAGIPDDVRMAILGHAWDSIVTDGRIDRTPTGKTFGKMSVANTRAEHRFFVFNDAESKMQYNEQFGSGDFFSQNIDHIHGMARDIALMERFGPNPGAQVEWMKQINLQEAAKAATGKTSQLEGFNHLSVMGTAQRRNNRLDGYYEQYRGVNASQGWLALSGTILRNNAMSALLGSSAIAHTSSNWYIQTLARRLGGIPSARVIPELLTSFTKATKAEMLRAGLDVEQGAFSLGAGARQAGALQKVARWSRWLPDRTTHLTGLIPVVNANKSAFNRGMMSYLADLQKTDWDKLPERIRSKLHGYGLREWEWKIIQLARTYEPDVGSAHWLRPIEVNLTGQEHPEEVLNLAGRTDLAQYVPGQNAPGLTMAAQDEANKIAFNTTLKFMGYMTGEREVAVPQTSMKARAIILGKTDPNTFWGLARGSAGMFKNFMGSFMVTQLMGMQRELARGRFGGISYIASMVIGMTLMGMMTLQLKQLAAGKDPLPMDAWTQEGRGAWLRAMMTSGSFGIFGDFIQSDLSSFGHGVLETLAGPMLMGPMDAIQGGVDLARSKLSGGNKKPASEIISDATQRFLGEHVPFLSTAWMLRAAYHRILLDNLQFLMDPAAHYKQRQAEERLRKQTDQQFWWRPGDLLPYRFPHWTTGR